MNAKIKKLMAMLVVAGLAVASYAAVNDTLITFSTPGPDVYGDGTAVLPGECYALVWWSNEKEKFGGIKADGTAVDPNDKVVLVADIAKQNEKGEGYCPLVVYQVDAELAKTLEDGQYSVYLLDTRVTGADGKVSVGLGEDGKLKAVNTLVAVSDNKAATVGGLGATSRVAAKAAVGYSVDCYAKVDDPVITSVKVDGAKITITASGLSPVANYWVLKGGAPGAVNTPIADATFDVDGKCTFDKPEGTPFFKIGGGYKVEIKK